MNLNIKLGILATLIMLLISGTIGYSTTLQKPNISSKSQKPFIDNNIRLRSIKTQERR